MLHPIPLLSVVTVTFRDLVGLRRTLSSLEKLVREAGANVEVLVMDGGSGPDIQGLSSEFSWAHILSEPDRGIYDAMNKGLARSRGSFVWFLNGGDECSLDVWAPVDEMLRRSEGSILLASYYLRIGSRLILREARSAAYIWHGLPTSHQAIFYPGLAARSVRYDERFRMVGDYDFTARLLVQGVPAKRVCFVASTFYMDGVSFQNSGQVATEANMVQRETLRSPTYLRTLSRMRHGVSRNLRRLQARVWH